jgi:ribokinase
MFDIITFGSATWDVFIKPDHNCRILKDKDFISGKGVCFNLGSKVDIEDVNFSSGGGGTNTASAFAKQGFRVAYCGKVGDDISGKEIIDELKNRGVAVDFIIKTKEKPTNHSIVINALKNERTILVYRGASELLKENEMPFNAFKGKVKWFYLAPLSGKLAEHFEKIVDFAKKNNIKVAANLGNSQLYLKKNTLKKTLKNLDVLILNQEEASILTGIPYNQENKIFRKIDEMCDGIAIMTKGDNGVSVSDGKFIYKAEPLVVDVVDKTGAGDAFSSGFVSGFIGSYGDIEYAIQKGTANSAFCISKWGAKTGLLSKSDKFKKTKVEREHCSLNNLCNTKR